MSRIEQDIRIAFNSAANFSYLAILSLTKFLYHSYLFLKLILEERKTKTDVDMED